MEDPKTFQNRERRYSASEASLAAMSAQVQENELCCAEITKLMRGAALVSGRAWSRAFIPSTSNELNLITLQTFMRVLRFVYASLRREKLFWVLVGARIRSREERGKC
jgi:hypothetical protein